MRLKHYSTFFLLFSVIVLFAQDTDPLPHWLTDKEALEMPAIIQKGLEPTFDKGLLSLPPGDVRTMAEWEEVEALMIAWTNYPSILTEITRHAVEECRVIIVTSNSASVSSQLTSVGVSLDNVEFLDAPFNTVWIRDYGPWTIYQDDVGELAISDYVYNRPRPFDDNIPYETADYFDLPIYAADENPYHWVHTGGNHLRDGLYNAWSSDLVLTENSGKDGREISEYARLFLGVEDYRTLRRLPYDGIHHLDMHMRTLDEETIIIGEYPEGVSDGPQIEANIDFIRNHYRTPYGNPYRIIRQQMPPENGNYPSSGGDYRTYSNGIFINNTFLMPIYEEQYDIPALDIYKEYLPGYNVVGIDCNQMIGALGALHCITKLVGVEEPLWIAHSRMRDTYASSTDGDYWINAMIKHSSGIANANLYYRLGGGDDYTEVAMMQDVDDQNQWTANIPEQDPGTTIHYYIQATANSGKVQVRPLPAPEGYYFFDIKAYEAAPATDWVQTSRLVPQGATILFTDDSGNGVTNLDWSFPGGTVVDFDSKNQWVAYPEPAMYNVSLDATNPIGTVNKTTENAVEVMEALQPFVEDFENPSLDRWQIVNEDNDAAQWEYVENIACHNACLKVNNFSNSNAYTREYLRTSVSFDENAVVEMLFDVAYSPRNTSSTSRWDELRVNIIDQNGDITNVYNKGKFILQTTPNNQLNFQPSSCDDWRTETVDISEFAGQNVIVEFESIGDRGNNLYLDNIMFDINIAPDVVITSPLHGTVYGDVTGAFEQEVSIDASDSDGTITAVELYLNGALVETLTDAPYQANVNIDGIGFYCFTAKAIDEDGAESWSEEVCIETQTTGVDDLFRIAQLPLEVNLSPNPVSETAQVVIESTENLGTVTVQVLAATGQLFSQQDWNIQAGQQVMQLNAAELPAGVYFLRLIQNEKSKVVSFVKK